LYNVDTYKVLKVEIKGRNNGFCPLILLIIRDDPMASENVICCVERVSVLTLVPVATAKVVVPVERVFTAPVPAVKVLADRLDTDSVPTVKEDMSVVLKVP
jgi:hypothetical protein